MNEATARTEAAHRPTPAGPVTAGLRVCTRCVMDTSDPEIEFDENGVCNHCKRAETLLGSRLEEYKTGQYALERLVPRIKAAGEGKEDDCVLGVSGGADSTYAAYIAKELGLRPLAVHFDNGWNSELAVKNIENTLKKLGIELYTHVVDWHEFRDLQLSFLKASVPDAEIPTDHAIWALLYQTAARFGVRYVISGTNITTESILPRSWTYYVTDWRYIKGLHRRFGTRSIKSYPRAPLSKFMQYVLLRRIKTVSILNAVEYDKAEAVKVLEKELGWRNYGGKHHESIYTRFFQSYILPRKFGIDKRKAHLSSLIMSGQITREDALRELAHPIEAEERTTEDKEYVVKKLGLTEAEFDALMDAPVRSYRDYTNDAAKYEWLKRAMRFAQRRSLLPKQVGM